MTEEVLSKQSSSFIAKFSFMDSMLALDCPMGWFILIVSRQDLESHWRQTSEHVCEDLF